MRITILHILAILFSFSFQSACAKNKQVIKVTGTYTNIQYNNESGDLNGIEILILPTPNGFKAVIQIAEGGAGAPFIVDLKVDADHLSFKLPASIDENGSFEGVVHAGSLNGTLSYSSGSSEKVILSKSCSYWDK